MARTIAVSEDAYRVLESLKQPSETFSEVILRRYKGGSYASMIGAWSDATPGEIQKLKDDLAAMRRLSDEKLARRLKPRRR